MSGRLALNANRHAHDPLLTNGCCCRSKDVQRKGVFECSSALFLTSCNPKLSRCCADLISIERLSCPYWKQTTLMEEAAALLRWLPSLLRIPPSNGILLQSRNLLARRCDDGGGRHHTIDWITISYNRVAL
jgi:hypothetical protein